VSAPHSERIARAIAGLYDVYKPEGVGIWLKGAKRDLNGVSPLEVLAAGRVDEFEAAVERLRSGAMG
jgi:hypothetical protein